MNNLTKHEVGYCDQFHRPADHNDTTPFYHMILKGYEAIPQEKYRVNLFGIVHLFRSRRPPTHKIRCIVY